MIKPIVMVTVEGGIATATVVSGDITVLEWDWDVVDDTTDPEEIERYIDQAEQLPDSYYEKEEILRSLKEAYETLLESEPPL